MSRKEPSSLLRLETWTGHKHALHQKHLECSSEKFEFRPFALATICDALLSLPPTIRCKVYPNDSVVGSSVSPHTYHRGVFPKLSSGGSDQRSLDQRQIMSPVQPQRPLGLNRHPRLQIVSWHLHYGGQFCTALSRTEATAVRSVFLGSVMQVLRLRAFGRYSRCLKRFVLFIRSYLRSDRIGCTISVKGAG